MDYPSASRANEARPQSLLSTGVWALWVTALLIVCSRVALFISGELSPRTGTAHGFRATPKTLTAGLKQEDNVNSRAASIVLRSNGKARRRWLRFRPGKGWASMPRERLLGDY
jgi:hypothetical protein